MLLEFSAALAIAQRCAPDVAPETLLSVVRAESGFNPLAININGAARLVRQPRSAAEAVRVATDLWQAGANFDLGLGQINSKNLGWLKLSLAEAFEPCANLAAAARVLQHNYAAAARSNRDAQRAVRVALSRYNSGDDRRGFRNGYVGKVEAAARHVVPAIAAATSASPSAPQLPAEPPPLAEPPQAQWDVFGRGGGARLTVFQTSRLGPPSAASASGALASPEGDLRP